MYFVSILARLRMESSLSGHLCGVGHEVSDGEVNNQKLHRGLIRTGVNNVFQRVCVYVKMYVPCLVLQCVLYTSSFFLAVVPYSWWYN